MQIKTLLQAACVGLALAIATAPLDRTLAQSPPAATDAQKIATELKRLLAEGKTADAAALAKQRHDQLTAQNGATDLATLAAGYELGRVYRLGGQLDLAEAVYRDALAAILTATSPAATAYHHFSDELVELLKQRGRIDAAIVVYQDAIDRLRNRSANSPAEGRYLQKLGMLYRHKGAFKEAEQALRAALTIMERDNGRDHGSLLLPVNSLAGISRVLGRYEEAEALYKRAIELATRERGAKHPDVGILQDNLGILYQQARRFAEAEAVQKKALEILEASHGSEHLSTAQVIANLAATYYTQRRHEEALQHNLRAIVVFEKGLAPGDPRLGTLYDNTAGAYRELGKQAEAARMYERALQNLLKAYGPDHPEVGTVFNNLSVSKLALRQFAEARDFALRALKIGEASYGKEHETIAITLTNIAGAEFSLGNASAAAAALQRAVSILESVHDKEHHSLVQPLLQLGETELSRGQASASLAFYRRAATIELKARARDRTARPGERNDRRRLNDAFFGVIDAAWEEGRTTPQQRAIHTDAAFKAAQWAMLTTAGSAIGQLGARLGASSPALARLVRERQDIAAEWSTGDIRLTAAVAQPPASRDAALEARLRKRQGEIEARLLSIDGQLNSDFPAFAELAAPQALAVAEAQALLGSVEALLVYVTDRRHVHAFLVKRDQVTWQRLAISAGHLSSKVQALRCGLDPGEWIGEDKPVQCMKLLGRGPEQDELPFDTGIAADLYAVLLKPFEVELRGTQVLIAASGALSGLPFQALLAEQPAVGTPLRDMKWVASTTAMTVLPSVPSLKTLRRQIRASQGTKPFLGIGNPILIGAAGDNTQASAAQACVEATAGRRQGTVAGIARPAAASTFLRGGRVDLAELRRLEPLPETRDELCAVARSLGANNVDVLLGDKATETNVRRLDGSGALQAFRIVHFATHGLVPGELEGVAEPALVLTPPDKASEEDDGLLTASEVAALRLDADWVILSACNTSAGDGPQAEAFSGLARAFFYAGARALLVSHWPVQSTAAVMLTTTALGELQRDPNLARAEALRRAMSGLIADGQQPRNAHPQVWAPFVVVGGGAASSR